MWWQESILLERRKVQWVMRPTYLHHPVSTEWNFGGCVCLTLGCDPKLWWLENHFLQLLPLLNYFLRGLPQKGEGFVNLSSLHLDTEMENNQEFHYYLVWKGMCYELKYLLPIKRFYAIIKLQSLHRSCTCPSTPAKSHHSVWDIIGHALSPLIRPWPGGQCLQFSPKAFLNI